MKAIRCARRAFTLLEVVVAVAIVSLITVSIYGFVGGTLNAARATEDISERRAEVIGFNRFVQSQFAAMPLKLPGSAQVVAGKTGRSGSAGRADAVSWIALPGSAILARRAEGVFVATLEMLPSPSDKTRYAIFLSRSLFEPDRPASAPLSRVLLLDNTSHFEVAFYDARINNWVDEWRDAAALPDLVRFRIGSAAGDHEVIARLPYKTQR